MELEELKEKLCDEGFEDAVVFENPDYASAAIGTTEDGCVVYSFRSIPYAGDKKPVVLYPFRED